MLLRLMYNSMLFGMDVPKLFLYPNSDKGIAIKHQLRSYNQSKEKDYYYPFRSALLYCCFGFWFWSRTRFLFTAWFYSVFLSVADNVVERWWIELVAHLKSLALFSFKRFKSASQNYEMKQFMRYYNWLCVKLDVR